jgi:hypothetical protein
MRLIWTAFTVFCALAFAQDTARDDRWRSDIDALAAHITAVHPNPYTRTADATFRDEVRQLRDRIPSISDAQVVVGISRILALLNDGHSSINLTQPGSGIRRYPVVFRWCSDGLFVTSAPEIKARLIGSRVLAMNGRAIDAVYEAIRPWISYDTESWFRFSSQNGLALHEVLVAAEIMADGAPMVLDVETLDGTRFSEEIPLAPATMVEGPMTSRPRQPLFRRLPTQDYWFEWIPESRTVYIQYNRCRENALLPIRSFAAEIIAFAQENPPDRWIFDVRENSGGNSVWFQILLSALRSAYDSRTVPPPPNGAFGIIGKRTFSSGSLAVRDMQQAGMILVGETTGGRVFWFGETTPFTLPNSRLTVAVSARMVGNPEIGREVAPHVPVEFTGADYFANRDPYLEAALRIDPASVSTADSQAAMRRR